MITSRAWAGKRYGVLGLARSGAATVEALLAAGAQVVAWDADEVRRAALAGAVVALLANTVVPAGVSVVVALAVVVPIVLRRERSAS